MKFHIAETETGYIIYELGIDQILHPLHHNPIKNCSAAEKLRDHLTQDLCPLELTAPSDGFDPLAHAATCYDIAEQIFPLIGDDDEAWFLALKIADRRPWILPYSAFDSELPF